MFVEGSEKLFHLEVIQKVRTLKFGDFWPQPPPPLPPLSHLYAFAHFKKTSSHFVHFTYIFHHPPRTHTYTLKKLMKSWLFIIMWITNKWLKLLKYVYIQDIVQDLHRCTLFFFIKNKFSGFSFVFLISLSFYKK